MKKEKKRSINDLTAFLITKEEQQQIRGGFCPGNTEGPVGEGNGYNGIISIFRYISDFFKEFN